MRQGDPLSPLLFFLDEDVLSRNIGKLVLNDDLELIKSSKNTTIPSHIVYADDILLFCTGKLLNIWALKKVFQDYSKASGQNINLSKSFFYPGEINSKKIRKIVALTGFRSGSLPFTYLGVPLFNRRVKVCHFS